MNSQRRIANELKRHAPFTALGALTGIILLGIMSLIRLSPESSHAIFHALHPAHIALSALVTTALYRLYGGGMGTAAAIGFVGAIAICSVSDIGFPYLGGVLLGFPTITLHVCFIEHPLLISLSALAGIAIGILWPRTRFPHTGHVLLSTYASLFYLTAFGAPTNWVPLLPLIFLVLFVAVWIPCCVSDIVFPLLFVIKEGKKINPDEMRKTRKRKMKELEHTYSKKVTIDHPIEVTDESFEQFVESHPMVIVDFWAQWCPPCHIIAPIIEELAKDYAGKVVFGKLNTDENKLTAKKYNIMSIPNLLFFKNGKLVDQVIGAAPRQQLEQKIKRTIG